MGKYMIRHIQILDAASFLNPISNVTFRPGLTLCDTSLSTRTTDKRPITLSWITSNSSCRGGERNHEARRRVARPLRRNKKDDAAGCAHLIEAQQYAYHPMLVQLQVAHKGLTEYMTQEDIDDAPPGDTDAQALAQVSERCQLLEQGRNSLSRRVKVVLDTM
ncbi:hypothetical protein FOBRF1_007943 [Fusarium oxysporum]